MNERNNRKLWQIGSGGLNPLVEKYTVGDDYVFDQKLLPYDIQASIAHAQMLKKIGVLSAPELRNLKKGLKEILALWKAGKFLILPEQEDGHTAIEQFLTEQYGEVGKKIHTGRSRNDQALVMLRLYMKEQLGKVRSLTSVLANVYKVRAKQLDIPMPGYTHMQKAMPTKVATWLESYELAFKEIVPLLQSSMHLIDQNPLGSASGFGIRNLRVDRVYTTKKLEFKRVQKNPMHCGLSRGYFEFLAMQPMSNLMVLAAKFASDMMLFTTQEFAFFSLPHDFTTGSSIMPQKRNYDVFEVMRANSKVFSGFHDQIRDIAASLGSGYHRDYQVTKRSLILGVELCIATLEILNEIVTKLEVNKFNLEKAMTADLFVTEDVYALVDQGMNFRDAYLRVKKQLRT